MLKRRLLSLLVVVCMLAGMVVLPGAAAVPTTDASFDETTLKIGTSQKVPMTADVYAVLWDSQNTPFGLPESAVKLTAAFEQPNIGTWFEGTLNMPDKVGLYEVYITTDGGSSWKMNFNVWGSYVVIPGVGVQRYRIWVYDVVRFATPNEIVIKIGIDTLLGDVMGVVRKDGETPPASCEIPDDAFSYSKTNRFDESVSSNIRDGYVFYEGNFQVPEADGDYIIYSTVNSGATWESDFFQTIWFRVLNGKVVVAATCDDFPDQWSDFDFYAKASLENGTITSIGGSKLPTYGDYKMSLVNDFTGETIETKDCVFRYPENIYAYGEYYADFALPDEEGFYKVYLLAWGMEIQADKAFWVDDKGTATPVELKGINSAPSKDFLIFPIGTPEEDKVPNEFGFVSSGVPYIDLTYETLVSPDGQGAVSTDGGRTWNNKISTLSKYLDSRNGVELMVSDKPLLPKERQPPEDATLYRFPKIMPRQVMPKLTANYQALYLNGAGAPYLDRLTQQTFWALTKPNSDAIIYDGLEISVYDKDSDVYWHTMPETGVAVQPLNVTERESRGKTTYNAKVEKSTYYVRMAPVQNADGTFSPASKYQKLSAEGLQKPAAVKPNYNKENVKPPKDTSYRLGKKSGVGDGKKLVDLSDDAGEEFVYRKLPTRKKPASVAVKLKTAEKAQFDPKETDVNNGKLAADSELQFNYGDGRWGKFKAPRGEQSGEILVRTKPKAKSKLTLEYSGAEASEALMNETEDVEVASEVFSFEYDWGEYENTNGRTATGITDFEFAPVDQ